VTQHIGPPPASLRKAKLDNLALLPGSELSRIARYQEMANELPDNGVLIVLPSKSPKQKRALLTVAKLLAQHGHQVRVISSERVTRSTAVVQAPLDL
jgi:hypothetical protein